MAIRVSSSCDSLEKPRDRSERAVGLEHGEIDLVRSLVLRAAEGECESAKVEWSALDRIDEGFARWLVRNSFQGFDHESPDQIALDRHKARLGIRTNNRKCGLIRRHHR